MQNEWNFPICQIVGYKNSGKTTLMESLITYFSSRNLQVGTLKHHGHGGEPEQVTGTDSYRHLEAGSKISAVQGDHEFQLTVNDSSSFNLDNILQFYTLLPIDILLIEGYKKANYPKIILIKNEEDRQLLELSNIIAIGSWDEELIKNLDYDTFSVQKVNEILPELAKNIWRRE